MDSLNKLPIETKLSTFQLEEGLLYIDDRVRLASDLIGIDRFYTATNESETVKGIALFFQTEPFRDILFFKEDRAVLVYRVLLEYLKAKARYTPSNLILRCLTLV